MNNTEHLSNNGFVVNLANYDAFLFDLDGTLIDSEGLWAEAVGRALADRGQRLGKAELATLVYGRAWNDIYEDIAARFPGAYPSCAAMTVVTGRYFNALRRTRDIRIPGAVEAFARLAAERPAAIVSGSSRQEIATILEELMIATQVRFFLGCEDYQPGKPHPACYLLAAQRLDLPPARCLVFEDSAHGVQAARAAGMACVAFRRPHHLAQDLSAAQAIFDDWNEFTSERHPSTDGSFAPA